MKPLSSGLYLGILTALVTLSPGCASKPPKPERPPYDAVPPDVAGTAVPAGSRLSLREPEAIRTYQTGRYIDPWNPGIMHEAGQIYVLSESASWNTRPNLPPGSPQYNRELNIPGPVTAQLQVHAGVMKSGIEAINRVRQDYTQARKSLDESRRALAAEVERATVTRTELVRLKERYAELVKKVAQLESRNRSGIGIGPTSPPNGKQVIDFEDKTK